MEVGRRADIDDVDIAPTEQIVKRLGPVCHAKRIGKTLPPCPIDIADSQQRCVRQALFGFVEGYRTNLEPMLC